MKMNTVSSNLLRNKKFLKKIPSQDTFRNGQNFNIFTSIKVCSFLYYYLSCRMKTNPEFCYEEYKDFNILKNVIWNLKKKHEEKYTKNLLKTSNR